MSESSAGTYGRVGRRAAGNRVRRIGHDQRHIVAEELACHALDARHERAAADGHHLVDRRRDDRGVAERLGQHAATATRERLHDRIETLAAKRRAEMKWATTRADRQKRQVDLRLGRDREVRFRAIHARCSRMAIASGIDSTRQGTCIRVVCRNGTIEIIATEAGVVVRGARIQHPSFICKSAALKEPPPQCMAAITRDRRTPSAAQRTTAAAVGSLISRATSRLASDAASRVARRCRSSNRVGTVITALWIFRPRCPSAIKRASRSSAAATPAGDTARPCTSIHTQACAADDRRGRATGESLATAASLRQPSNRLADRRSCRPQCRCRGSRLHQLHWPGRRRITPRSA